MPSKRKFYLREYTIRVISEEPIPEAMELKDVLEEADSGSYSLRYKTKDSTLNAVEAAKELLKQASDPEFFRLTDKGEDLEDDAT